MIECSNCKTEIMDNFCPNCGQKFIGRKLKLKELFSDYWDNFFSVDKSLWLNFKLLLLKPGFIVQNYWAGFRNFFISPNKLLIISALFLGINFIFYKDQFLGLKVSAQNFSAQLGFLVMVIPFLTISSYIAYIGFKRGLIEHLVLNMYSLGIWLIIFSVISIAVSFFKLYVLLVPFKILFLLLIFTWNARAFKISFLKSVLFTILNTIVFGIILAGIIYWMISNQSPRN